MEQKVSQLSHKTAISNTHAKKKIKKRNIILWNNKVVVDNALGKLKKMFTA